MPRRSKLLSGPLLAAACLALVSCRGGDEDAQTKAHPAFVERIQPADFSAVEALLPENLSRTCDIVVISTSEGRADEAIGIRRAGDSCGIVLVAGSSGSGAAARGPVRIEVPFDPRSAAQLRQAFMVKLHRNVFLSDHTRKASECANAHWILLQGEPPIAALIDAERVAASSDGAAFMKALVDALFRYATCEPEERGKLLLAIDRASIRVNLEETARR